MTSVVPIERCGGAGFAACRAQRLSANGRIVTVRNLPAIRQLFAKIGHLRDAQIVKITLLVGADGVAQNPASYSCVRNRPSRRRAHRP